MTFVLQRFGQGVMKYRNGDVYEGIFEYDLYSKVGKMMYKDGSVYEGSWSNGLVRFIHLEEGILSMVKAAF